MKISLQHNDDRGSEIIIVICDLRKNIQKVQKGWARAICVCITL